MIAIVIHLALHTTEWMIPQSITLLNNQICNHRPVSDHLQKQAKLWQPLRPTKQMHSKPWQCFEQLNTVMWWQLNEMSYFKEAMWEKFWLLTWFWLIFFCSSCRNSLHFSSESFLFFIPWLYKLMHFWIGIFPFSGHLCLFIKLVLVIQWDCVLCVIFFRQLNKQEVA